MNTAATRPSQSTSNQPEQALYVAFELSSRTWKLGMSVGFGQKARSRVHSDPRVKYMPPGTMGEWNPASDVFVFKDRTAEDYELARTVIRKQTELIVPMRRAGVEFLAGTDVLNPYCFPGFSLHDELEIFVQAGLSPMEALQTATLNPARFLGRRIWARSKRERLRTSCCSRRARSKTSATAGRSMRSW